MRKFFSALGIEVNVSSEEPQRKFKQLLLMQVDRWSY
jgi:hypothetical protein